MIGSYKPITWPIFYIISITVIFSTFALSALTGVYFLGFLGVIFGAYLTTLIENSKEYIAFEVLLLLSFQNAIIGIFGHIGSQTETLVYLTQIPFAFLFLTYVFLVIQGKLNFSKETFAIFIVILCIIFALSKGGSISNILLQVRNLTTFYFGFEVGKYSLDNEKALKKFVQKFVYLAYFMLFIGIILLVGGFEFYKIIGIENVYVAKGQPGEGVLEMPGRFTTDVFNIHIERMGSLYYEPVTLSYFFAAITIYSYKIKWTESNEIRNLTACLMLLGVILTGGKGGMLIIGAFVISNVLLSMFSSSFLRLTYRSSFWCATVISFVVVGIFSNYYGQEYAGPAAAHFNTIEQTFQTILRTPFGHGLAQGGFNTPGHDLIETGAESALMSFGYQLGFQGILAIFLVFFEMTKTCLKSFSKKEYYSLAFIPLILFGVSLFQLNTYTPQAILPFVLVIGANLLTNGEK